MKILIEFFGSFLMVLSFGVMFQAPKKSLWLLGITGIISWAGFLISKSLLGSVVIASFIAAFLVGIFSEVCARLGYLPVTVFVIAGIIPLVPGIPAYHTMLFMIKGEYIEGVKTGIETLMIAGSIAFAVAIVSAMAKYYKERKNRKLKKLA
ncbi:MAG: threonine/serine exporter family protein [Halanaerobiales bacterium]|nr:threonine/serine exporter family protein [Halanaerobiales bacterium]